MKIHLNRIEGATLVLPGDGPEDERSIHVTLDGDNRLTLWADGDVHCLPSLARRSEAHVWLDDLTGWAREARRLGQERMEVCG